MAPISMHRWEVYDQQYGNGRHLIGYGGTGGAMVDFMAGSSLRLRRT